MPAKHFFFSLSDHHWIWAQICITQGLIFKSNLAFKSKRKEKQFQAQQTTILLVMSTFIGWLFVLLTAIIGVGRNPMKYFNILLNGVIAYHILYLFPFMNHFLLLSCSHLMWDGANIFLSTFKYLFIYIQSVWIFLTVVTATTVLVLISCLKQGHVLKSDSV